MKIAVITPINKRDYLTDTVLDGLGELGIDHKRSDKEERKSFVAYAREAELILFCWGKTVKKWRIFDFNNTNYLLAEEINCWNKTVFIDGNEVGRDGRARGLVAEPNRAMLKKCALYFKREKPYPPRVLPLPFGITKNMIAWQPDVKKDIDFFCVFGKHDEYLPLRWQVTDELKRFCAANNFSCVTERMPKEEFLQKLARSKVGISVGGGGFDTLRFWEILANNCLLMTEQIDIYPDNGKGELDYSRIWQFKDLAGFRTQLEKIGNIIRSQALDLKISEYQNILPTHSSSARVQIIITAAKDQGII